MTRILLRPYLIILMMFGAWLSPTLHAHLIPKQRGTLNFVNDGAFMALSLPISAFDGIDDDRNGLVSMIEFNKHRAAIISRIKSGVVISEKGDDRLLQGIMLSPVPIDEHNTSVDADIVRVYVMGKYVLDSSNTDLRFRNELYGHQVTERKFKISAARKSDGQRQTFELTPDISSMPLFDDSHLLNNKK